MWRIATHLLNFYRFGSAMAVKNSQLGYNESTFMSIFYDYPLGFSVAI